MSAGTRRDPDLSDLHAMSSGGRRELREAAAAATCPQVDAARRRIAALMLQGRSLGWIAARARVSPALVRMLALTPDPARIPARVLHQVLTHLPPPTPAAATVRPEELMFVDPTGTVRRMQALAACGWDPEAIAAHARLPVAYAHGALAGYRVSLDMQRRVRVVYDLLWDVPPPDATETDRARIARALAAARDGGWLVPMAWDDEGIDDPLFTPAKVTPSRTVREPGEVWHLTEGGVPLHEAVARTGLKEASLETAVRRLMKKNPDHAAKIRARASLGLDPRC